MKILKQNNISEDQISCIVELINAGGLVSSKYANTKEKFIHQYIECPNSDLTYLASIVDHSKILGFSGLIPQFFQERGMLIKVGVLSNFIVSDAVRGALIEDQNKKIFPAIALLKKTLEYAAEGGVDIVIGFTSIHEKIMRASGFKSMNLVKKEKYFYFPSAFNSIIQKRLKNSKFKCNAFLLKLFSLVFFIKNYPFIRVYGLKGLTFCEFDVFGDDIDSLYSQNDRDAPCALRLRRNIKFMNWRYQDKECIKYKVFVSENFIGYVILRRDHDKTFYVDDMVLFKQYEHMTYAILFGIFKIRKINIKYTEYIKKSGHFLFYTSKSRFLPIYYSATNNSLKSDFCEKIPISNILFNN